ncbi:rhomboid family intramembrane serine protease [Chryseobacterium sp. POE27]|uniref:rhomboid family intramembrane serine protease n=1 Tax=Chryseobacterium sp. POE27 TaxID=3138177 RepID=UPI00321B383C
MFNSIPPITRNIIIINVIVFIAVNFLFPQLNYYLSAFYPFSPNFRSWQIITHMFMHGGYAHILFNMLTLWSFGPVLEQALGEKKIPYFIFFKRIGRIFLI